MEQILRSESPAETEAFGKKLGAQLGVGDVVELRGELGAGKTCLTRGIARGLGIEDPVRSPTFTLCHVHRSDPPLFHLDAYRVEDPEELLIQGWDEMRARGIVVIEWGERVPELLPSDRIVIELSHGDSPEGRILRWHGRGDA